MEQVNADELEILRALRFLELYRENEPITLSMLKQQIGYTTKLPASRQEKPASQSLFDRFAAMFSLGANGKPAAGQKFDNALQALISRQMVRTYVDSKDMAEYRYALSHGGRRYVTIHCLDLRTPGMEFLLSQ